MNTQQLEALPVVCFVVIQSNAPGEYVGAVRRGERGYSKTDYDERDLSKAKELVAHMNKKLGVTELQADCMHTGSLFGWDVPGADPEYMAKQRNNRKH